MTKSKSKSSLSKRPPNAYIIFTKFIKDHLKNKFPHLRPSQRMRKAGEIWRSLPLELKNDFFIYSNNYRKLMAPSQPPLDEPGGSGSLKIINECYKYKPPMSKDIDYLRLFDKFIKC